MLIRKIYICHQLVGYSDSPLLGKGFYRVELPLNPLVVAPVTENRLITSTGRREIEMYVDPMATTNFDPARSFASAESKDVFDALLLNAESDNASPAAVEFRLSTRSVYSFPLVSLDLASELESACRVLLTINSRTVCELGLDEARRHFAFGPLYEMQLLSPEHQTDLIQALRRGDSCALISL